MKSFFKKSVGLLSAIALVLGASSCDNDDASSGDADSAENAGSVISTNPSDSATAVAINRKITATFNVDMNPLSVTTDTFTVTAADLTQVTGSISYAAGSTTAVFTFTPLTNLSTGTVFTAKLSTGVKTTGGIPLASDYSWTFTTGSEADTTAPTATTTNPAATASDIPLNRELTVVFAEAMDPTTITADTYTVVGPNGASVAGTVSFSGTTATFHPTQPLEANTTYTVTMTTEVKDLAGNPLLDTLTWTFTTGSSAAEGPSPVVMGTASDFVILAKSAISTTGTTAIVGNLGLSPAAQSFMTGFSEALDPTTTFATSSLVTGKMFAADMTVPTPANLTTAVSDMEIAYTDAAGRVTPDFTELGAGDVSGRTLVPGLYKWGTGLLMTSGVTLAGGANDVWIFQIAQDLTVSNGVQITLSGGALPKNIFWQVAGQVSLGTTSSFKGIILSQTQIVIRTGAVLNGRALAQTAVTLDANAITQPAP